MPAARLPACLPLLGLAARPMLLLKIEMDWLARWQAACLACHPIMDLFE